MYLEWGMFPEFGWWSTLWLILVFGLSLIPVMVFKTKVLWLLPAFALYAVVHWVMPDPLMFLFKLVFWGAVIFVIVTAILTAFGRGRGTRMSKLPLALMVLLFICMFVVAIFYWLFGTQEDEIRNMPWNVWLTLAVILGVIGFIVFLFKRVAGIVIAVGALVFLMAGLVVNTVSSPSMQTDDLTAVPPGPKDICLTVNGKNDRETIQTVLPSGWKYVEGSKRDCIDPTEPGAPSPSPDDEEPEEPVDVVPVDNCPGRFVQVPDPNYRDRWVSEGFYGLPAEKRQQVIEAMGHDYRYLAALGTYVFNRDIDEFTLFVKNEETFCLTQAGQDLYKQVKGALLGSYVVSGLAPANGYNSTVENGDYVIVKRQGVKGDRQATIFILPDGRKLILLDRCGNLVSQGTHY